MKLELYCHTHFSSTAVVLPCLEAYLQKYKLLSLTHELLQSDPP